VKVWSLIERTGVHVGMFYRQCMLVIDGKYNNKDGNKCAKDCRQVIDDKIRVSIDEKQEQSKLRSN
jgi:hypothetical protein